MTSDKESRKTVINEEIKSVKNTITEKEKNKVVPEKETFDAMEKSVTADAAMKRFLQKRQLPRDATVIKKIKKSRCQSRHYWE